MSISFFRAVYPTMGSCLDEVSVHMSSSPVLAHIGKSIFRNVVHAGNDLDDVLVNMNNSFKYMDRLIFRDVLPCG